jgi:hypothetical protein
MTKTLSDPFNVDIRVPTTYFDELGSVTSFPNPSVSYTLDSTFGYESDIYYEVITEDFLEIYYSKVTHLPFTLPSSVGDTTNLEYSLIGAPTWIWVDSSTNLIMADTNFATVGTLYTFKIGTSVANYDWVQEVEVTIKVVS